MNQMMLGRATLLSGCWMMLELVRSSTFPSIWVQDAVGLVALPSPFNTKTHSKALQILRTAHRS